MSTPDKATDTTLVNRAGVDYRITLDKMSTLQDTDLLLVNRAGVDYRCTAKDVKAAAGGGNAPVAGSLAGIAYTYMQINGAPMYISPDHAHMVSVFNNGSGEASITSSYVSAPYGFSPRDKRLHQVGAYRTPYGVQLSQNSVASEYMTWDGVQHSNTGTGKGSLLTDRETMMGMVSGGGANTETQRFRLSKYDDGWWYYQPGAGKYMHFKNPSTDEAVCNAAGSIETGAPSTTGMSPTPADYPKFGYDGVDGIRHAGANDVFLYSPATNPSSWVKEGTMTNLPGSGSVAAYCFVGDYLMKDLGTSGVFRNKVKGKYDAWTKCASTDGSLFGAVSLTYVTKAGVAWMFTFSDIKISKDMGLTWKTMPACPSPDKFFVDSIAEVAFCYTPATHYAAIIDLNQPIA
jgi:hypothetical protein